MSYPKVNACHFVGVGGVVIYENHVLLVKLTYGPAKGKWLIPGGLVDCGETLREAIVREIREETGQDIIPEGILGVRSMVRCSDNLTDLYCIFVCKLNSKQNEISIDSTEVKDVQWLKISELESDPDVTEYTRNIVHKALDSPLMHYDEEWSKQGKLRPYLLKYEQYWTNLQAI